jgi:transcription initiation factor IIE alpha subunit
MTEVGIKTQTLHEYVADVGSDVAGKRLYKKPGMTRNGINKLLVRVKRDRLKYFVKTVQGSRKVLEYYEIRDPKLKLGRFAK